MKMNPMLLSFALSAVLFVVLILSNLLVRIHHKRVNRQRESELGKQQDTIQELQTRIALSQIKSHFLYNALNSIYILCGKDLKAGRQAISDLSDYLRANMSFMDSEEPIPFEQEMDHVRAYLALEKLRFPEELNYSIVTPVTDFSLPALTVQPLVENAVRHGIVPMGREGILVISTRENTENYFITISDNGRGFDKEGENEEDRKHIGIKNVRERLRRQVGAGLIINSNLGEGTEVTIKIPKKNNNKG